MQGDGLLQEIPLDVAHDFLQGPAAGQDGVGVGVVLPVVLGDVGGQVAGGDVGPLVGDDQAVDHVLQFAHVPRPLVAGQDGQGDLHDGHALAVLGRILLQEVPHQGPHVLGPLAQGRDGDRGHVQPVIEVAPKRPRFHAFGQVLVGGGDDADIDLARTGTADAHDLSVLEHAQQAGLHGQGKLADLVEEHGPPVGQFEIPRLALARRAGEGAGHVAEHLGFGQGLGDAAAIHLEKDLVLAVAPAVGQPGEDVLAHAGLAQDEHRGVRGRDGQQHVHHFLHGRAGVHGREGLAPLVGDVGHLLVEMVDELALLLHLVVEPRDHGDVADKGHHQAQRPALVEDGKAGEDQLLAVLQLLHVGRGLARADDLGIEDPVEYAVLHQGPDLLALDVLLPEARQLLVHAVDAQGDARNVRNEHPVRQGVQDVFEMLCKKIRGAVRHGENVSRAQKKGNPKGLPFMIHHTDIIANSPKIIRYSIAMPAAAPAGGAATYARPTSRSRPCRQGCPAPHRSAAA